MRAIGFTASIELRLRRGDWISVGTGKNKQIIGQEVRFKVHKNKTGIPQRSGSYDFYFDEGGVVNPGEIDVFKDVVQEAIAYGVINVAGSWFSYADIRVQGADRMIEALREREDLYKEVWDTTFKLAMETVPEEEKDVSQFDEKVVVDKETGEILEDNREEEEGKKKPQKKGAKKKTSKGKKPPVENSKKKSVFKKNK